VTARLFLTSIVIPWSCHECEELIEPGQPCYRVLDELLGFPLVCGPCGGLKVADAPLCQGCEEHITKDQADPNAWVHLDGEIFRWQVESCDFCHGEGVIKSPILPDQTCRRCNGEKSRRVFQHAAQPRGVTKQ
jgi:hypothetical protein